MAQGYSIQSLVWVVIAAALLIFVLAIGTQANTSAQQSASATCSTEVLVRSATTKLDIGQQGLESCKTERVNFSEDQSENAIRNELVKGYMRCKAQFSAALEQDILGNYEDKNVFCHVCGVYDANGGGSVSGLSQALGEAQNFEPTDELPEFGEFTRATQEAPISLSEPLAIMFFQAKKNDYGTWTYFIRGPSASAGVGSAIGLVAAWAGPAGWIGGTALVGAGSAIGYVAGHFVTPDSTTASGIIIRPYDEQLVKRMGCTTAR